MNDQQANTPELKAAKERILEGLRAGTATGVVGVGIDPIQGKLIVFFSQKAEAENYLLNQLGEEFSSFTKLYPGKVRKRPFEPVERGSRSFLKRILQILARFPLRPASRIRPDDGDKGRIGCFVSLNGREVAVLTVEHLFYRRDEHEVFYIKCNQNQPQCFGVAGKSKTFGGLQSGPGIVNRADCALFSPSNGVVLKAGTPITGNFIAAAAIKDTETKAIKTLVPNRSEGQVLDADAAIKYEVVLGQLGRQEVLLEGQILIKSSDQGFGVEGDSGALVVIAYDDPNGPFKEGDALGLYSVIIDNGDYHYATPLYYCLPAVGAKGIHLP